MQITGRISRLKLDTLFFRLLVNFLVVITLFVLFYILSLSFNKKNIHEEVILYNQLNMDNTVGNYERQLAAIKKSALGLYWDENIHALYARTSQENSFDYYSASVVSKQLKSNLLESSYQYVDNIYLVFHNFPVIIDTNGVYTKDNEIDSFLASPAYGDYLWSGHPELNDTSHIFPAADFEGFSISPAGNRSKQLIPIVLKNQFLQNMNIVIMLDADRMHRDLHHSVNESLLIKDHEMQTIYAANINEEAYIPTNLSEGYSIEDENYFFNKQGESGLIYVNIIPTKNIAAKISQQNNIFLFFLLIAIVLSVIVSIAFSRQLNSPIKMILDSLKQVKTPGRLTSGIKEFNVISDNLNDLHKKTSALRYYAYSNKIKNIHSNFGRIQGLMDTDRPFTLLVIEVAFKKNYNEQLDIETNQAINVIREYVNVHLSGAYPGSLTFQLEQQQIVSIVFTDGGEAELETELKRLKNVFDSDRHFYFLTIAFTQHWSHPNELSGAYDLTVSMLSQRQLNDETQIIRSRDFQKPLYLLTANHEMEFHNYLVAGNEKEMLHWVDRQMNAFKRRGNFAMDYKMLGNQIKAKVEQTMHALQLDVNKLQLISEQLIYCCTRSDYRLFYEYYLQTAAKMIKEHKDERDPITTFVMEYLENNYKEDVSLEAVAEHLKITSGYLSTYFKEKTGWNYSDYLNNLRMEKAKHILQNTDLKVKTVAEQVGYLNVNSFIRMFKKVTGVTPGEFRKK